jgi:RNA polymerase sigma-70 factor (ECF subfamily)
MPKTIDDDPDGMLIRALQSSPDNHLFSLLVQRHQDRVYNFCHRFLGDEAEAADCCQEVFIRIFLTIKNFRFQSRFSTWIFKITLNYCLQIARSRKKMIGRSGIGITPDQDGWIKSVNSPYFDDPERLLVRKEIDEAFQSALAGLKEIQRTIVILKDLDGRSYEEISKITGINTGTVRSILSRARFRIAKVLREYQHELY